MKKKKVLPRITTYICFGEEDLNPGSPYKGDQVMPLSYKALG